mgnify:CR=1 FL=1
MVGLAEKLAMDIPFARVDFYEVLFETAQL